MSDLDLVDDHVRHHIGVQRLASGALANFEPIFDVLRDRLNTIMLVNKSTVRFPSKHAMRAMLLSVRTAINEAYAALEEALLDQLNEFVVYEMDFQKRLLERRLGVPIKLPSETRMRSIAERAKIGEHDTVGRYKKFEGQTVRSTLRRQRARAYRIVKRRVMIAVAASRELRRAA